MTNIRTLSTDNCPGNHPDLKDSSPEALLDRSLLNRTDFWFFARPWVNRARATAREEEWFAAMIYLWVTFNAWVSLVVSDRRYSEKDYYLWRAAGLDPQLNDHFEYVLATNTTFKNNVDEFRSLWPVFKVRTLVDHGVEPWGPWGSRESRSEYRARCLSLPLGPSDFAPHCYLDHQPKEAFEPGGNPLNVPLDWSHVLGAIYRVRCNLFHGGKSFWNSRDQDFTRLAYTILFEVWSLERGVVSQIADLSATC